jgi:DNA-binding response OmpR family regulator
VTDTSITSILLDPRETAILETLRSNVGRVVTRTELAVAAGLRHQPRRVDVHLVNVRRHLGVDQLVNVRSRGWMLVR